VAGGGSACGCPPRDGGGRSSAGDGNAKSGPVAGSAKVVTIQRDDSLDANLKPQSEVVQSMVDSLLFNLSGGADNPWSVLLPDADRCTRIGLKVNCLAPRTPTSPVLVHAIVHSLKEKGGFCPSNIIIWERYLTEMLDSNKNNIYAEALGLGARAVGTNEAPSPDGVAPAIRGTGPGYGEPLDGFEGKDPGVAPRISKVLADLTDVTINVPVLKAHPECGFTVALKGCYGMFDCPQNYHHPYLQDAMPKLYAIPEINKSVRLTIMDALRASVTANNASPPDRSPARISASLDPLALDCYALDLANQLRTKPPRGAPLPPLRTDRLVWMENAHKLGIGARSYRLVTPGADGEDTVDGGLADAESQSG